MRLLQFSTSHYCRKARLTLGYKRIPYEVENLIPGQHILKVKPLTGLTTVPVLLPEQPNTPPAIGDSTRILQFLESYAPDRPLLPQDPAQQTEIWQIEDWLDESIGIATRIVYYQFRAGEGRSIDPSVASRALITLVRRKYGINQATATLAAERIAQGLRFLEPRWQSSPPYLVGDSLSVADITAVALLSPLMLIPTYRSQYPWLLERITTVHHMCQEPLPPGV